MGINLNAPGLNLSLKFWFLLCGKKAKWIWKNTGRNGSLEQGSWEWFQFSWEYFLFFSKWIHFLSHESNYRKVAGFERLGGEGSGWSLAAPTPPGNTAEHRTCTGWGPTSSNPAFFLLQPDSRALWFSQWWASSSEKIRNVIEFP